MNEIIKICKELSNRYIQSINLHIKQLEGNLKSFQEIIEKKFIIQRSKYLLIQIREIIINIRTNILGLKSNHYSKIIEKQLELDKKLNNKFEQQMQEFQIYNQIEQQNPKYQDIENDQKITNLENQINSFLSKRLQQSVLNEQFQQLQQNNCKLDNYQAQIIQKIITVQDKLKEQQKNCANEQGIFSQNFELKINYLERLKTHLNSISFCNSIQNEFQIKTNEKILNLEKEKMRLYKENKFQYNKKLKEFSQKAFNQYCLLILLNPYQPQFNSNCKLAAYQVIKPSSLRRIWISCNATSITQRQGNNIHFQNKQIQQVGRNWNLPFVNSLRFSL
ncbi:unnamed protein product [Paramecium pentaurelia]|uniref:Uncharacterized protein n=1 Tax=Paramecium pentaurelia TaxID=43138 RepID=A0A8S1YPE3_9CILI|nr:unnamed protein product [Paramecium pentaurelia]